MKTLLMIALIVLTQIAASADEKDAVGRYQLIYAAVDSFMVNTSTKSTTKIEQRTVFKIDTVTGQVWKYADISLGKAPEEEAFVAITTAKP
jgi:hypothetical protein